MAESYAYFQVAHKVFKFTLKLSHIDDAFTFSPQRIIDYVPMTVEHELNQMFVSNLQDLLFSSITQEAEIPGRLEELVQESPSLKKRRTRLETRRADLLKIKQKLNTFWSLTRPRNHSQELEPGSTRSRSSSVSADAGDYQSIISAASIIS